MDILCLAYCTILILAQIKCDVSKNQFDIFNFKYIFQLYYFIQLPLMNFMYGTFAAPFADKRMLYPVDDWLRDEVSLYIMVGHTALFIGLLMASNLKISRFEPRLYFWHSDKVKKILLLGLILQISAFIYIVSLYGGISSFISNLNEWRYGGCLMGKGMFLFWIQDFPLLMSCLMAYYFREKFHDTKIKVAYIIYILYSIVLMFIMGFRGPAFYFLLVSLIACHYMWDHIKVRFIVIFMFLAFVAVFISGIYRIALEMDLPLEQLINYIDDYQTLLTSSPLFRIKGSEIFARVLEVTNEYRYGLDTLLEAVTIVIPGWMWDKPEPTLFVFSRTIYGLEGGGITPTILANLYWEFGIVGITFGMLIIGLLLNVSYNTLSEALVAPNGVFYYACTFIFFIILSASLNAALNFIVIYFFMYFLFMWYLQR